VIAPSPASSAEGIPPKKRDHDFWGLDFRLPNLFQGNPESIVRFEFAYETCARSVALHHPYPLGTFSYLEKEISK
jgi:hypothetical protein